MLFGGGDAVGFVRVGGVTVRNCRIVGRYYRSIEIITALATGQTVTVNNCILTETQTALQGITAGDITESYNCVFNNITNRINVLTSVNSIAYSPLPDPRWFFELVSSVGRMVSPFDLAGFSQLINLAGISPPTTDMRGMAIVGAQREWGALEYDPALLFRRVIARQV